MNTRREFAEADFRKSSFSNPNQDCVAIASRDGRVEVRDSKTTFGSSADGRLAFRAGAFRALRRTLTGADTHE